MDIEQFDLERGQSLWENVVELNLSESGVHPLSLRELGEMGLDLEAVLDQPLVYVQTNGTPELRAGIAQHYPGAGTDDIEVTNGTAEANFLVCHALLQPGDRVLFEAPNYLQVAGLARSLGAEVNTFSLRHEADWEPDWDAFERGLAAGPKLVYLSHPNNPCGKVLGEEAIARVAEQVDAAGAWLVADEVYRGAEHDGSPAPSFWGRGERVVVTSGLSKSYGLPGARIGWLVGPRQLVDDCWLRHDYSTIAPGALSDRIARFAVVRENQARLQARARSYMVPNRDRVDAWAGDLDGLVRYREPQAGAYAFVELAFPCDTVAFCNELRERHGVLVVPGAWMGMEGYLRLGLGSPAAELEAGLDHISSEIRRVAEETARAIGSESR
ncbi:MAG: aminotransferase class I/II-fold pyridoxal phosphate-dependent enzyme [Acidobacteriota bacterium]|nr:aminotransferase class I/II-fold pyridoxal phosphate-dependent enzyme [Acidobacteriota bacterium]